MPPPILKDSSVSSKDEIWFLRVCHRISNAVYLKCYSSKRGCRRYVEVPWRKLPVISGVAHWRYWQWSKENEEEKEWRGRKTLSKTMQAPETGKRWNLTNKIHFRWTDFAETRCGTCALNILVYVQLGFRPNVQAQIQLTWICRLQRRRNHATWATILWLVTNITVRRSCI
jgi:hypothetical protein